MNIQPHIKKESRITVMEISYRNDTPSYGAQFDTFPL